MTAVDSKEDGAEPDPRGWTGGERADAEAALRASEARLRFALAAGRMGAWTLDLATGELTTSATCRMNFGRDPGEPFTYDELLDAVHPDDRARMADAVERSIATGEDYDIEYRAVTPAGDVRWIGIRARTACAPDGAPLTMAGVSLDVTARRRDEEIRAAQSRVLELAMVDTAIGDTLDALVRTVEGLSSSGVLASVLLVDDDGRRLRHGAGPSLPAAYNEAVDGIAIGPNVGSCGTAAHHARPVYVADIAGDPLWADFRDLALSHGLRACWSTPILSNGGAVLGTFALYYREPREANPEDLVLVDFVVRSAALIIERHRAVQRLRASETRYRQIVEGAEDFAIVMLDRAGIITSWNSGAERILGFTEAQAIGRPGAIFFTPEDRDAGVPALELSATESHGRAVDERWHMREDGSRFWGSGLMTRIDQEGGGYLKIFRDRTAEHEAEAAIRGHEARYRTLFEGIDVGFSVIELKFDEQRRPIDYRFVELNPAFERLTGRKDAEGKWVSEVLPGLEPRWFDIYGRVALTGEGVRFEDHAAPLGRWYDVHAFRTGAPDEHRVAILFNDISERRRAEDRLHALNADLERQVAERTMARGRTWELSPDLMTVANAEGRFEVSNPAWQRVLGWTESEVATRPFADFIHPDDLPETMARFADVLQRELPVLHFENRYRTRAGDWRWLSWVAVPEGGKIYCTGRDVTEIKAQAAALAERTTERNRMWRNSRDILLVIGADGIFKAVSPAWRTILGHAPDEVVGHSFLEFVLPDDAELTQSGLDSAVARSDLTNFENRYRHRDGSVRWIAWQTSTEGEQVFGVGRDITAEKEREAELAQAQDALRQSQKMEAVGQLTGGIAHDFNNMLAVVIGSLDLLGRRIGGADARARRYVDAATDGARRAALLTQRLLAFSRQQPLKPEPIELNKLVAGMSDLFRHSLGGEVQLETVLAGGLWRAHADPNQLENVLLNLAVNGRDAMADGGRLTIETQNAHLDARYAVDHPGLATGQYVMIAVTDTGSGMPPAIVAKAFDPFFTTKEVGKGTGLGLSQVYGFVKQSGGHVNIYSEPGEGTTVKIYLPRLIAPDREAIMAEVAADMPLGDAQEIILVVEDEPSVRQLSTDALGELGYRVLEADSAAAALRLLDAHPEIVLMFTDIVMPEVNGAKLAEEARRRRPDLKVLFTTGYTRNAVVHNGALDPGVELIGKPFTIEELAAKMREVLDRPVRA